MIKIDFDAYFEHLLAPYSMYVILGFYIVRSPHLIWSQSVPLIGWRWFWTNHGTFPDNKTPLLRCWKWDG